MLYMHWELNKDIIGHNSVWQYFILNLRRKKSKPENLQKSELGNAGFQFPKHLERILCLL